MAADDSLDRMRELLAVVEKMATGEQARATITPRHDELDALAFGINALFDELGYARRSLERLKDIAEASNREKSLFLRNVSHELRTPLSAVLGLAPMLARPELTEDRRNELLQRIERNGDALLRLLDELLALSRVDLIPGAGQFEVKSQPVELQPLIADVVSSFEPELIKKELALSVTVAPTSLVAQCDARRLRQILMNLVSNAIKFTLVGEVRIVVAGDSRGRVTIEVRDTGIGLTPEQRDRLFTPFQQAHLSFGGTGLGLVVSRRLAEAMGGELAIISSAPGVGTVVRLVLARAAVKQAPPPVDNLLAWHVGGLVGVRLLIVEDDADIRDAMGELLVLAGADVTTAEDGERAVAAVTAADAKKPIDLVLMDVRMPRLDGLAATRRLRAAGARVPIIALTADAVDESREECLAAGCNEWIRKPIEPQKLFATITGLLPARA